MSNSYLYNYEDEDKAILDQLSEPDEDVVAAAEAGGEDSYTPYVDPYKPLLRQAEEALAYTMAAWSQVSGLTMGTKNTIEGLIDTLTYIVDYLNGAVYGEE